MSFDSGDFGFFARDLTVFVRVSLSENEINSFVSVEVFQNRAIESLFAFGSLLGVDLLFEFDSLGVSFDSGDFGFIARNLIVFVRVSLSENEIDGFVSVKILQNMFSNFSKFGAGFLAAGFAIAFSRAGLLGTGFLAAGFLAVEFLAVFSSEFLAAGFLAVEFLAGFSSEFLAAGLSSELGREGFLSGERFSSELGRERFLAIKLRREGFLSRERFAKMLRREGFLSGERFCPTISRSPVLLRNALHCSKATCPPCVKPLMTRSTWNCSERQASRIWS